MTMRLSPRAAARTCDVTGTQGPGIPAGIGADSGKFRLWTGIPGIRDWTAGGVFRSGGTPGVHTRFEHTYSTKNVRVIRYSHEIL